MNRYTEIVPGSLVKQTVALEGGGNNHEQQTIHHILNVSWVTTGTKSTFHGSSLKACKLGTMRLDLPDQRSGELQSCPSWFPSPAYLQEPLTVHETLTPTAREANLYNITSSSRPAEINYNASI